MPKFSKNSLEKLNHPRVHPKLKKLMLEAIKETPIDFTIIESVRCYEKQKMYMQKGVTKTMRSKHIPKSNKSGLCEAIDIAPYPINWGDIERFKKLSCHIKETAKNLSINIVWGGDWGWDYPHYELKGG